MDLNCIAGDLGVIGAPGFYAHLQVPDTPAGRFDLIALHAFVLMRRLKGEGAEGAALSQALFDLMFDDLDRSLREMGVGDLGVGRRVKGLARGFYGRVAAYDEGLAAGDEVLEAAIKRNLYGAADPTDRALEGMTRYLREVAERLATQPAAALLAGAASFPPPPGSG